jgi:hypothetical protein
MKAFTPTTIVLGFLIALGQPPTGAADQARKASPPKKADADREAPVTILVLSYQRLDGNALADQAFLPRLIKPALAKLKDKGLKKARFNFKKRQLYLWLEGKKVATLKDIKPAFPGLELKVVAEAVF